MRKIKNTELVINSSLVTNSSEANFYEFVLNDELSVTECGLVESLSQGIISPIYDFSNELQGALFELNHVRVNPRIDNTMILANLAHALNDSGVEICSPPATNDMRMCFKPLGELSEVVRFYITYNQKVVFLSNSVKLTRIK